MANLSGKPAKARVTKPANGTIKSEAVDKPSETLGEAGADTLEQAVPEVGRANAFEQSVYPYKTQMRRPVYERHKAQLQVELLKVQRWVEET
ncbi:MAG: hypothetical protein KDJ66_00275, partial [Nitratireductor sp.]|nr:hypothetical protein [Nitratireductor sp.]